MCNRMVDTLIRQDKHRVLRFAPLQGETARQRIPKLAANLNTIVAERNGEFAEKTTAILWALEALGGFIAIQAKVTYWVPKAFRDWAYDLTAPRRYRILGKRETCRMPSPEERAQFLP